MAGVEETKAALVGDQDLGIGLLDGDAGQRTLRDGRADGRDLGGGHRADGQCDSTFGGALRMALSIWAASPSTRAASWLASAEGSVTLPPMASMVFGAVPRSAKSEAPGTLPRPATVPPLWVRSTETMLPLASAARMNGGVPA